MKDSIYVLSGREMTVEKLHLCTWDVRGGDSFVEVGLSVANNDALPARTELWLVLPFLDGGCTIASLHEQLGDNDTYKFIFNEIPESLQAVDGEKRNGSVVRLSGAGDAHSRTHLVANATAQQEAGQPTLVKVSFDKPAATVGHAYVRLLIRTKSSTIAEVIPGIAKCSYIFDVKINEARNIPSDVLTFKRERHLSILPVRTAYCLHCVPNNWEISFSDYSKMKNIRKLEKDAFKKYLPLLEQAGGEYIITFIKQSDASGSYSFFTTFNREVVGNKQLFVAVVISLLCNLLFAFSAFREKLTDDTCWIAQVPAEWWVAVGVIVVGLVICLPVKNWWRRLRNKISNIKKQ